MPTQVHENLVRNKILVALLLLSLAMLLLHMGLHGFSEMGKTVILGLSSTAHAALSIDDGGVSKRSQGWQPSPIFEGIAKLHFIVGLSMFLFIAMMVVADDLMMRALLLVPVVLLFWGSKVLFAIDQANMAADMMRRYKGR